MICRWAQAKRYAVQLLLEAGAQAYTFWKCQSLLFGITMYACQRSVWKHDAVLQHGEASRLSVGCKLKEAEEQLKCLGLSVERHQFVAGQTSRKATQKEVQIDGDAQSQRRSCWRSSTLLDQRDITDLG
jgi:hypothetical protein